MSLQQQLDEFKVGFVANTPPDAQEKMEAAKQALADSGMLSGVPKEGDTLPEFTLPNQLNSPLSLSQLRANGPVLIVFYRGGWCPYCNLELRAYQAALDRINAAGAMLVAITPELADESLNTIEKNELHDSLVWCIPYLRNCGLFMMGSVLTCKNTTAKGNLICRYRQPILSIQMASLLKLLSMLTTLSAWSLNRRLLPLRR